MEHINHPTPRSLSLLQECWGKTDAASGRLLRVPVSDFDVPYLSHFGHDATTHRITAPTRASATSCSAAGSDTSRSNGPMRRRTPASGAANSIRSTAARARGG